MEALRFLSLGSARIVAGSGAEREPEPIRIRSLRTHTNSFILVFGKARPASESSQSWLDRGCLFLGVLDLHDVDLPLVA